MEITAVDFFRSKYVMDHPDIMRTLDVALVKEVKNLRQILAIGDGEERKHQEALILWRRITLAARHQVIRRFNIWIGNGINTEQKKELEDLEALVFKVEEKKRTNINEEVKDLVKKYSVVKKEAGAKKTRKLTTPIYASIKDEKLMELVPQSVINKPHFGPRLLFEWAVNKGITNIIWDSILIHDYGDKSEKPFPVIRHMFSKVSYHNRSKFKDIFPTIMLIVHNLLIGAGIYDDYPTFSDYKNMTAHIILRGKDYCYSIVKNPQLVRPLLEYDEFHPIWNHYKNTL
jgi:hypothetical protein